MTQDENVQILLLERPRGPLQEQHFKRRTSSVPELAPGQILVRTILISIDAANRGWMQGRVHYRAAVDAGQLMAGNGLGEVIESRADTFRPGDIVFADLGWQTLAIVSAAGANATAKILPLSHRLSVFGIAGKTAYYGLTQIAGAKAGETVLVSAAGGAVGSFAGQIAKNLGCRAVGIAGGEEKCRQVQAAFGYDAVVNHRSPTFFKELRAACANGIDVYFDNTGGVPLEGALSVMNLHGRIACCGAVSQYDSAEPVGPRGVPGLLAVKRLRMEGFLVHDFVDEDQRAKNDLQRWMVEGRLRVIEDIIDGIENAPVALIGLLAGQNLGKRLIRVAPDPI